MRRSLLFVALSLLPAGLALSAADYPVQPVPFTAVRVTGGFWQQRQEINRTVTLPFALQQCEESGRMKNFDLAAEVMRRRAAGETDFQHAPPTIYPFDDTDPYKAIEGAAYVLSMQRDAALEARVDGWIERIAAAQEPDGYLFTFRTMHPDSPGHKWVHQQRWLADPELSHELYNLGHLYEAGVAYFHATGKRALLDVCLKNADLLWQEFGTGKLKLAPGHQIIEMALVRLYRVSGDPRHLQLAKVFLEAREGGGPPYNQRHKRVVEQDEAVGHAVRANYMYSGMADVAALTGDERYFGAARAIWDNVVAKKLYLTGGVGAKAEGEAYGANYELPHNGYNETCAALALMQWSHRMFLMTGEARYMDVFERTCFNGFLSGVSLSGDRFFYPNPLTYDGQAKNNHGFAGRAPWFGCACCPPNLMRTLASLTGSFYAVQ
ncbi:MAG TPA: beta-L-arabinofuranosidase domain-containing protein [Opitutus sp.]|nr:beta-L-arabinofuranosidase domain-containing protein [Opitutus sp.]